MQTWMLFIDGASIQDDLGAGVILVSPSRGRVTYALRFEYECSSIEVEYETLITEVNTFGDSMLVTNQIKEMYKEKEGNMNKYLARVKALIEQFNKF